MIEKLAEDALKTYYFWKLYKKVSLNFIHNTLYLQNIKLTNKELTDILRFADIFSNSKNEKYRNISYKIISLLYDTHKNNLTYNTYSNAVLKKLNNFPALKNSLNIELPISRELQYLVDKEILKSPLCDDRYFLPNQYIVYKHLQKGKSLTFSGPTSMGKSFVIKQFILEMISSKKSIYNFCIIVPTRALIKQYVSEFNAEFQKLKINSHKIVTNANILEFLDITTNKFVFILTQERLNVLLYTPYNIKVQYLIVDEAYKIFDDDTRGLTFYNTIDTCLSNYKDIKILFSSPLIDNPEIFKNTFKPSIECYKSNESPVSQNLFYVDLKEKTVENIDELIEDDPIKITNFIGNRNEFFYKIGAGSNNIVYLSGQDRAITYSLDFVDYLQNHNINLLNEEETNILNNLCILIEKNIHKDFFLINALKKGVAYHYGKLPTIVRENIEILFKKGIIKYLFCTSTLIEGVNLPAKNLFIMANYNGIRKFKPLEFWNLAGRAGRLGYEYYGNIFCVNDHSHNRAWKTKDILYTKNSLKIEDVLENKIINDKDKIIETISNDEPVIDLGKNEKYTNYLANIIQIDNISNNNSIILEKATKVEPKLLNINNNKSDILDYNLINSNKTIDYKIQSSMSSKDSLPIITKIDYSTCLKMLQFMYTNYKWNIKEDRLKNIKFLNYIALLMNSWINGRPLNEIIESSINYYANNNKNIDTGSRQFKRFMKNNPIHVNALINQIIDNIENILRFDLEKYFNHYYNLLKLKYSDDSIGCNIALYLEFGTRNTHEIILQNSGFTRYTSHILYKYYSHHLKFNENTFDGINKNILSDSNLKKDSILYNEITNSSYIL